MRSLFLVLLAALLADAASAQAVVLGGRRCATPEPTVAEVLESIRVVDRLKARVGDLRTKALAEGPITVPVAMHVVTAGAGRGDVPDAWIEAQIDTLNSTFAPFGYRFALALVERVENATWYEDLRLGSTTEEAMKEALARDPARYLNLYTASLALDYLGWATPPDASAERDSYQGVVLLDQSLPGGNAAPYNLGHTGTHEVGHWLGLLHTFAGGCSAPNDGVADTPWERSSASGCPANRDTCPVSTYGAAAEGLDPVHNYMDYSDDACMTEFTDGQIARSIALTTQYHPTITAGGFALATLPRGSVSAVQDGSSPTASLRLTNATGTSLRILGLDIEGADLAPAASLPEDVPDGTSVLIPLVSGTAPHERPDYAVTLTARDPLRPDVAVTVAYEPILPPLARVASAVPAVELIQGETGEATLVLANDGPGRLSYTVTSLPDYVEAIDPTTGVIPAGGQVEIALSLSTAELPPDAYTDAIEIETNDPLNLDLTISVPLTVIRRPSALLIGSIRPNPSAGDVTITVETPDATAFATVEVFDTRGRLVATLASRTTLPLGYPAFRWDASAVPSGVYIVRVRTPDTMATGRVVIAR